MMTSLTSSQKWRKRNDQDGRTCRQMIESLGNYRLVRLSIHGSFMGMVELPSNKSTHWAEGLIYQLLVRVLGATQSHCLHGVKLCRRSQPRSNDENRTMKARNSDQLKSMIARCLVHVSISSANICDTDAVNCFQGSQSMNVGSLARVINLGRAKVMNLDDRQKQIPSGPTSPIHA